jgi:hypothetical protein
MFGFQKFQITIELWCLVHFSLVGATIAARSAAWPRAARPEVGARAESMS